MTFDDFNQLFLNNAAGAIAVAVFLFGLTRALSVFLSKDEVSSLSDLLTGQTNHTDWSRSFLAFFELLFGKSYVSARCVIVSCIVSLLSVVVVWVLIGGAGFEQRLGFDLPLGTTLATALTINLVADFISLAETRFVLRHIDRFPRFRMQIIVLFGDFLASLLIIGVAIWIHRYFQPDLAGEDSISQILGAFSLYSVMLYSTFVTSVWSWIFLISAWIVKITSKPGIARRFKIAKLPVIALSIMNAIVGSAFYYAGAVLTETGDGRASLVDRGVCLMFRDKACINVARISSFEEDEISFLLIACEAGLTRECVSRGVSIYKDSPEVAVRYWEVSCDGGNGTGCANLGYMYDLGLGVEIDRQKAHAFREEGCEMDSSFACYQAGQSYRQGKSAPPNYVLAKDRYIRSCNLGEEDGCGWVGSLMLAGDLGYADSKVAADWLILGCEGGDGWSCYRLGRLHRYGDLGAVNTQTAKSHYEKGCALESGLACGGLADMYEDGVAVAQSHEEAMSYFEKGCDFGNDWSCARHGRLLLETDDTANHERAMQYIQTGCENKNHYSCDLLADLLDEGTHFSRDTKKAMEIRRKSCLDDEYYWSCYTVGSILEETAQSRQDRLEVHRFYDLACDLKDDSGCFQAYESYRNIVLRPFQMPNRSLESRSNQTEIDGVIVVEAPVVVFSDIFPHFGDLPFSDQARLTTLAEKMCRYSAGRDCWEYWRHINYFRADGQAGLAGQGRFLSDACANDTGWACHLIAVDILWDTNNSARLTDALGLFEKACLLDNPLACSAVEQLLQAGLETNEEFPFSSIELLWRACKRLDGAACYAAAETTKAHSPLAARRFAELTCESDFVVSFTYCTPYSWRRNRF